MKRGFLWILVWVMSVGLYAFPLGKYGDFHFEKVHQNVYVMHGPVTESNKENEGFAEIEVMDE
jgi:hypothetical protein